MRVFVKSCPFILYLLCLFAALPVFGQTSAESEKGSAEIQRSEPSGADANSPPETIEPRWRLKRGAHEFSVETSYAPMQPTFFSGRKEYNTDGRRFAMTSFRYGRVIGTFRNVTYEYSMEIIPVALAINNDVAAEGKSRSSVKKATTYGVGIQPISFRFIFMSDRRLKPYVRLGAGFIFTNKPIPVPGSTTYNFIGDFGGGLMYHLSPRYTMNVGYRYFHISNMNIGEVNPGYNANMFYVGYSVFSNKR